jgi:hypothetical protein
MPGRALDDEGATRSMGRVRPVTSDSTAADAPQTAGPLAERLLRAVAALALASTRLHPDDVDDAFRDVVVGPGVLDASIYVVDLDQVTLVSLAESAETHPVDEGDAGLAYRTESTVVVDDPAGGVRAWLPLMDSAERFGVVTARLDKAPDPAELMALAALANFAGELVANKSTHGDTIALRRRRAELSIAAEMRWSLLPPLTFTGRNVTISGLVEPAHTIAGDTFDYAVDGDTAHMAIIDAVGHGLEAARIANLAVSTYRSCRRRGLGHIDTYVEIDATLLDQFGPEKFATAQLASFDLVTGRLQWINAGHPPPMLIRGGVSLALETSVALPLGLSVMGREDLEVSEATLEPGDRVLFFTDGVTESRSASGVQLGRARLADLACALVAGVRPAESVRLLGRAVLDRQHGTLNDDATLLLLVWDGPLA